MILNVGGVKKLERKPNQRQTLMSLNTLMVQNIKH